MSEPANPKPRMIIIKVIAVVNTLFSMQEKVHFETWPPENPVHREMFGSLV